MVQIHLGSLGAASATARGFRGGSSNSWGGSGAASATAGDRGRLSHCSRGSRACSATGGGAGEASATPAGSLVASATAEEFRDGFSFFLTVHKHKLRKMFFYFCQIFNSARK